MMGGWRGRSRAGVASARMMDRRCTGRRRKVWCTDRIHSCAQAGEGGWAQNYPIKRSCGITLRVSQCASCFVLARPAPVAAWVWWCTCTCSEGDTRCACTEGTQHVTHVCSASWSAGQRAPTAAPAGPRCCSEASAPPRPPRRPGRRPPASQVLLPPPLRAAPQSAGYCGAAPGAPGERWRAAGWAGGAG